MDNMTIFDYLYPSFKIDKPIRLIELFAGVGSQAMALRDLGADLEHYKVVEFDRFAVNSYNAIHGTDFKTTDITEINGSDLEIVNTNDYCYILTYSFPCQDLSLAGRGKGMAKGSGTRSGLLWEVERLLDETKELPQVLLMENVPQVISDANIGDFHEWQDFLVKKGYTNYVDTLNAKDFGVAQNRNRTFMVSLLGEWNYKFPQGKPLTKTMKDYLEDEVEEKYYIDNERTQKLIQELIDSGELKNRHIPKENQISYPMSSREFKAQGFKKISPTICARDYKDPKIVCEEDFVIIGGMQKNQSVKKDGVCTTLTSSMGQGGGYVPMITENPQRLGGLYDEEDKRHQAGAVWNKKCVAPTLDTMQGGNREPMIMVQKDNYLLEPQIKKVDIPQTVRVRKHDIDTKKLIRVLREHKNITNKEMAKKLNKPITLVEHWFRKDNSFSIPDADIWYQLKELLGIQTDEFDLSITEFVEQDGVYEKANRCYMTNGISPTITSAAAGEKILETVKIKQATEKGYAECKPGGVADLSYPESKTRRGRVQDNRDTCPTLMAGEPTVHRIESPYRIRKLTPLECWRLMGFTDEDFRKAEKVNSNSQLYKQAGNSIVKDVLMAIFKQML